MSGCEGGCGVELTTDMRETADGFTTVHQHTIDRCRLVRTLREAGQAAVGSGGTSVVRASGYPEELFVVHVSVPHRTVPGPAGYEATARHEVQCAVGAEYAWSCSPDALEVLGGSVEEMIRSTLDHPGTYGGWSVPGPVLARDPYAGGSW